MTTITSNYGYYYPTTQYASNNPEVAQSYLTNTVQDTGSTDSFTTSSETCTDGKDDGKIGFFGAIGNAIKGVGKSLVNGVKGMFTNKEGKFSLGKTLLSVGTIALCVAFPAVGVAAACIGGVMAGAQVVKGAVNASNAKTDAEAKAAWQDIGGGTFGVIMSVVGAKAGMKAVGKTSTAGLANLDDAAQVAAKANGKTSALSQLDDAATFGQKAKAYGQDMLSSTKNQGTNIYKNIKNTYNSRVDAKAANKKIELNELEVAQNKANSINKTDGLTPDEYSAIREAEIRETFAKQSDVSRLATDVKVKVADAGRAIDKKYNISEKASHPVKTMRETFSKKSPDGVAAKAPKTPKTETGKLLDSASSQIKNTKGLSNKWDLVKGKFNKNTYNTVKDSLTSDGQAILKKLNSNESINSLIKEYGYENVEQTIATVVGAELGFNSLSQI